MSVLPRLLALLTDESIVDTGRLVSIGRVLDPRVPWLGLQVTFPHTLSDRDMVPGSPNYNHSGVGIPDALTAQNPDRHSKNTAKIFRDQLPISSKIGRRCE
ncbi:hypothetical protein N7467_011353 [Penicillium canescens]|nr:hypothetical protein N7467_011353 [Penicillium canescens]